MPVNTIQSKKVYLTLKPKGIDTGGTGQLAMASKLGVNERMYVVGRDNESNRVANVSSELEENGWTAGNGDGGSGMIGNFRSTPVFINLKTPEKQQEGDGRSFQILGGSSNGWSLLEALKGLSPLRGRKSVHENVDKWFEEDGQRAVFDNGVELDMSAASESLLNEYPGNERNGGELRRSELYISLGSATATPGIVLSSTVGEGLSIPVINTVEELQSSSRQEFLQSSNSQTTVLVNYDLESSSTEILPAAKSDVEQMENEVALKDYIFYVQVKPQNVDEIRDENSEITPGTQNVMTLEMGDYRDEADDIVEGDDNVNKQLAGTQDINYIMLPCLDREGGPPVAARYERDVDMELRNVQVSHLSVKLGSCQGDSGIESELYSEMSADRCNAEMETDDVTGRCERWKDEDGLRSSSWISLDNISVTEEAGVLFSPNLRQEQFHDTVLESPFKVVKSKPLFVTLKPASQNDDHGNASVESEDKEIGLLPSFQEQCEATIEEARPVTGFDLDNSERNEQEGMGTSDMGQVEICQSCPEMGRDEDESKEFVDGGMEKDMVRGQQLQQTGIKITLKSRAGYIHEEVKMVGQPEGQVDVMEDVDNDESKEFVDGRKENDVEILEQEVKQTGTLYVTLKPQKGHGQEEGLWQEKLDDSQVSESQEEDGAADGEVIQNEDGGNEMQLRNNGIRQTLEKECDESVTTSSDGQRSEYFGFSSRAEYLRSKIGKALKSSTQGLVDQRSIVYDNRQEMQTTAPKSQRVKELLRRLGRDGESTEEEVSRHASENEFEYECMRRNINIDQTKIQTSSVSFTLWPAIDQQHEEEVAHSVTDGNVKETISEGCTDDGQAELLQNSQCLDVTDNTGAEDHERMQVSSVSLTLQSCIDQSLQDVVNSTLRGEDDSSDGARIEEVVESASCEEVRSPMMVADESREVTVMPDDGQTHQEGEDRVRSETLYIQLNTSNKTEKRSKPVGNRSGWHQFLRKEKEIMRTAAAKQKKYSQKEVVVSLQSLDDQQMKGVQLSPGMGFNSESVVEVLESVSCEEVSSVLMATSGSTNNDGVALIPETSQWNWMGDKDIIKSETVSIRLKTNDGRGKSSIPGDLLNGNQAEDNGTVVEETCEKGKAHGDSHSPPKQKLLGFGIKKRLEQFGEHAAGIMGDIAQGGRDLAVSVVKKDKSDPEVQPTLREVVLWRLRSREENGDVTEKNGVAGKKLRSVRSLFTPEEHRTLANAADHVDAAKMMQMMLNLVPDLSTRVREAEFEEEVRGQVMKMVDALKEWTPTLNRGETESSGGDIEGHTLSESGQDCDVECLTVGMDDVTSSRIVEALMRLKLRKTKGEVKSDEDALERFKLLDLLKKVNNQCKDKGAQMQEFSSKVKDALSGLKPNVDRTDTEDKSKVKDVARSLKPAASLGSVGSEQDGLEISQLSKTLQKLVPDWTFGRSEDRREGDRDSEMSNVMEVLKKLKPNLDAGNVSEDEEDTVIEMLKKLNIASRWQNSVADFGQTLHVGEAVGVLKSVLAEGEETANLTVSEFSRMRDVLGNMMPHWSRESEDADVQGESSIDFKEAALRLKPNFSGGDEDGENSKIKDLFMKLAAVENNESNDGYKVECQKEKVGMFQALREMIAPRRPGGDFEDEETGDNPPEDGTDILKFQTEKDAESREKDWRKAGKLLRNLLTFGTLSDEVNDMISFQADGKGERLLVSEKATDFTQSRVKEAMMKLKALDGEEDEISMSGLKKPRWLKAVMDFLVLGDETKYQSLPSDEVLTASKMSEVEAIPGTSKDEDAVVNESTVEASPTTSPVDHFKAREALQSLNEIKGDESLDKSNRWRPWKIFAMSTISKKEMDAGDTEEVAGGEENEQSSHGDKQFTSGALKKKIDIVGLTHPFISKRRLSSSRGRKAEGKNERMSHGGITKPKQKDENIYMTFKMTRLSGFSPVSSSNSNVIVHDVEVLQTCICIRLPFFSAIRNYVMTDADIARKSTDSDGFLIISGDGDAALNVEVQEDIVAEKVGDQEDTSGREEVNMDELADMLNGEAAPAEPEEEEGEPEGEVVTEEQIAEVKVGGVEAGISVQWPGGDEEQTEEAAAETVDNDKTDEVAEEEDVEAAEKDEEELNEDVEQKEDELVIEVQVNGEEQKEDELVIEVEVNGETKEEEVDVDEVVVDEVDVDEEAEKPAEEEVVEDTKEEVVENTKQEDESPEGNVAIEITLGEKTEEKKEETKEDVTEKVPHVRPGRVAKNLSDRIRAFENKNKENEPVVSQSKRSSSKLDSSKVIKYQGSIDEHDGEPVKPVKGAGRLDMSRFSLFQRKSESSEPPKKNFTIKPVANKNRFTSQEEDGDSEVKGPSSTDTSNRCLLCEKRVYPMEKITADGKTYHKSCFRCTECKKVLSLGNFAAVNTLLFCKPHFKQRFKLHGNYDTGFSQSTSLRSPSTADDISEFPVDKAGVTDEIASTQAQTTESTPVIREDLVRSSDTLEERKSVEGGTKSLLERFKQGSVSNVEIRRAIDEEKVSVRSLDDYQPPPPEEEEDTHIKPQDMIDTDRDHGQSAESQPQESREDVVRSNYETDEVRSTVGMKNLKSMFEKGGVSNIEVKVQREKIEVKPLGEVEDSEAKAVAENVPESRRADVVSGGGDEDPGIKLGLAQKMRAQFEKGNVSNIEEKPRPDLERTPKTLDDFADEQSAHASQSVSESTPQRRDDVVRSDEPLEEQSHLAEGTRSLLSRWEKGEVEHAEEKPKESLSEPKDFKAEIQVSESTPEQRDDLVRETDQVDESVPEGFTKTLAGNLESEAEFHVEVGVREDVEDEESSAKRLSEGDDNPEVLVSIEINGNVSPGENGHSDGLETTPNGHYENDVESPEADPSLEIKAARAAALEDQEDEGDATMMTDSR